MKFYILFVYFLIKRSTQRHAPGCNASILAEMLKFLECWRTRRPKQLINYHDRDEIFRQRVRIIQGTSNLITGMNDLPGKSVICINDRELS